MLVFRALVFRTAAITEGTGEIEGSLKRDEPAYIAKSKTGRAVRVGWKKNDPDHYAMYIHCQTNLVETFRTLFPDDFKFMENRALLFTLKGWRAQYRELG